MEKEVLCCCHDVTLVDVKNQIKLGVNSFDKLQEITKIGTDCPPCKEKNEKLFKILLNEELEK
jgi:bacterioferritin-associated ferredoxin